MKRVNEYKWSFRGTCPVDRRSDKYWATLRTGGFVEVLELLEFCKERKEIPTFQEDWGKLLSERFGGEVTLLGWHHGVRIESVWESVREAT